MEVEIDSQLQNQTNEHTYMGVASWAALQSVAFMQESQEAAAAHTLHIQNQAEKLVLSIKMG